MVFNELFSFPLFFSASLSRPISFLFSYSVSCLEKVRTLFFFVSFIWELIISCEVYADC